MRPRYERSPHLARLFSSMSFARTSLADTTTSARGRAGEVNTSEPSWREEAVDLLGMLAGSGRRGSAGHIVVDISGSRHIVAVVFVPPRGCPNCMRVHAAWLSLANAGGVPGATSCVRQRIHVPHCHRVASLTSFQPHDVVDATAGASMSHVHSWALPNAADALQFASARAFVYRHTESARYLSRQLELAIVSNRSVARRRRTLHAFDSVEASSCSLRSAP